MFSRRYFKMFGFLAVASLIATACSGAAGGGAGEEEAATDAAGEEAPVVRHAASSTADAYVGQYRAPEMFGDEFGLSTENHLTQFESHATASQVILSGGAEVGSGSMIQAIQLIQEGQDFKVFCPVQKDSTEHLVGLADRITSLEQITDPDIRVAIDSPGGLVNFIMNLVFRERGLDITTDDLENVSVLEDGSLRLSALGARDVDVGSVDLFELPDLVEQLGEENISVLSVVAEDVEFLANIYWAPTDWLEENTELAGRYCATTLHSNRQLAADFDQYTAALDQYIEAGVPEETARAAWEFAREHQVWPYNTDVLNEETVQTQIEVAVDSGLLEEAALDFAFEDIVDTRPMESAIESLGGPIDPEDVTEGDL